MDIPVNAAKPGRRRYLTLVMIFITVVICYVDRANRPWLLPIFRKSLVLLKRKWLCIFGLRPALYAMSDPRWLVLDRVGSRVTYFIAIFGWSVATLFGLCHGLNVINWSARDNRYFRSARVPDQ